MAWNGLGTYVLNPLYSPESNGSVIDATRYNGLTSDLATGITQALNKNGENSPTANINWGGFKITNAGNPTATGDVVTWGSSPTFGIMNQTGANYGQWNAATAAGAFLTLKTAGTIFGYFGSSEGTFSVPTGGVGLRAEGQLLFGSNATERARFDLSGRFLVGTTTVGISANTSTAFSLANGTTTIYASVKASGGEELLLVAAAGVVEMGAYSSNVLNLKTNNTVRMSFAAASGDITAQGVALTRVKTAATSRNTTTTFADDPHLTGIALAVGRYDFEAMALISAAVGASGAGYKLRLAFTGTITDDYCFAYNNIGTTNACIATSGGFGNATVTTSPTPNDWVILKGTINVTVAGNASLQWAQNTSNGNNVTFNIGSSLKITKVG